MTTVRIGTRGSALALWQAGWVKARLEAHHPIAVTLVRIKTSGDKLTDVPLAKLGGKGLFVKEIEEALLRGTIDLAVHSTKDLPAILPAGLHLGTVTEREDPRDALASRGRRKLAELPAGARIGTSSLRRAAQLLRHRPNLTIEPLRGNLDTRLRKLDMSGLDAIVVAAAGVKRLGLEDHLAEYLPFSVSLPAIGQGALAIECRVEDHETNRLIACLHHPETGTCITAERAFLHRLQGSCQVPMAGHASFVNGHLRMEGLVLSLDGTQAVRDVVTGPPESAAALGGALAERLLAQGADQLLKELYGQAV